MERGSAWSVARAALTRRRARWLSAAGLAVLIAALASPASAQYFGRNKVRYRSFDFQVLETEHFDIYFYPGERAGIDIAARLAERWYTRLERLFGRGLTGRQSLVLYASHADFEQTNVVGGWIDEGTGGFTEPLLRRVVLPLAGPIADTDHVLGHELVHAFQFDIAKGPLEESNSSSLGRLPLWFIEGMAEYVSIGAIDANTAMRLRDAVQRNHLPSIQDLSTGRFFPYQWGHAVLAYIAGRFGDEAIPDLLGAALASGSVEQAVAKALGISAATLTSDWHEAMRALYAPALANARPFSDATRLLVRGEGLGAELNVAPALSPDGKWVAFLSARSVFSTDLYVADAQTGRITRKLTSTATDAHYSSIQYINSAGAWDAASERIAMATVTAGQPSLAIFDARTGKRDRDISVREVDEILNPSWSPSGDAIVFTGMRQGLTDLFVYDLDAATLRQLTSDPYADLHASWSPDGQRIVFASDRFASDLESLQMGALRLAIADVATGTVEAMPAFSTGKHISPQWSGDATAIYFIADPDGIPNVYRMSLPTGELEAITAMGTGVSGITRTSPALSVASARERAAFSVFEDDQYRIYVVDTTKRAAAPQLLAASAAALPPTERERGVVESMLADPAGGLTPPQDYPTAPYKAKLALAGVAQPSAGVGVSRFGTSVGGGAALYFSDLLGDHMLATAVQVNTVTGGFSFNDVAFETGYVNLRRRWNWGVFGSQLPYLAGAYVTGLSTLPGGELVGFDREILYRETQRSAAGMIAYPFDRSRRVELQGGVSRTSFERIVNSITYVPATGAVLAETSETDQFAPPLALATSGIALVFDNANFGATSPIQGQRYRVEVSPTIGSISFTGVTVDYRRYVMPVSFYTIAVRVLHYGRYGGGGDDARLFPVYVNNPGLVRGYDTFAYTSECVVTQAGYCQVSTAYAGSRVLVGNVELRFPLLRPFGASRGMYGPVPVEIALFADTGVAWTAREKPTFAGGTRPRISSAGFAIRTGVGFAVLEFDFSRPFQRPGEGWAFGFNLIPGW
jgi:Tol biopolymer transport system component